MRVLFFLILLIPFSFSLRAEVNSFPEPMVYDLMRGLDAKKHETEINAIYLGHGQVSPEFEYAIQDGWAFEIETPMVDGKIQALKWGSQYTFFQRGNELLIGVQGIVEDHLTQNRNDYSLTLIADYQISRRFSLVAIAGIRSATLNERLDHNVGILNLSLFYTVSDRLHLGVENDKKIYFVDKEMHINTIPQISWRISKKLRLQAGVGFSWQDRKETQGIMRGIVEF